MVDIVIRYVSAWMWNITGIIFLCFSLLFFSLKITHFFVAFLFIFAGCEFMAFKRKREIYESDAQDPI